MAEINRISSENSSLKLSFEKVKQELVIYENDLESAEKECNNLSRSIKKNEKKIYDIEKENGKVKEDLAQEKAEFSTFRAQVNKEKKTVDKRNKKNEKKEFLKTLKADSSFKCDEILEHEDRMRSHMLIQHTRSFSTQTDFQIFIECHGLHQHILFQVSQSQDRNEIKIKYEDPPEPEPLPSKYSFPVGFPPPSFPPTLDYTIPGLGSPLSKCELCGWYARTGTDMINHKKDAHNFLKNPFLRIRYLRML